ncbi:hypothetical protein [Microbacterium sp. A1-JK]|uniref:hypothetical protein n=1 Tax=Microbacterium sp. A1-JK TaxID=3177516 RepID=UPI0038865A48
MKVRIGAAALAAVFILTGCASAAPAAPTEPPIATDASSPDNTAACESFWDATVELAQALTGDANAVEATGGLEAKFDGAYLDATGEVAKRIERTMDNFPPEGLHMLMIDSSQFMEDMESVVRACRADGVPLEAASSVVE